MRIIFAIIGCFFIALGVNIGFVPVQLFSTGFPGVGVLALYTLEISAGLVVFILNVPLFLLAWKYIGKAFVIQNFFIAFVLSVFLDVLYPVRHLVDPPLWVGILLGGILMGIGTGLVFRQGLTSGGTGLLARLVQLRFSIKMGTFHILFDFLVLSLGAIVMDVRTAFYTLLGSIIMGKVMDFTKDFSLPFRLFKHKEV